MYRVVVLGECCLEQIRPEAINLCKPLSNQAVEFGVCPLLRATLDNHRWQFVLQASRQGNLHQFVTAFFEIYTRHDRQVDGPSEIDEICVALILDVHLSFFLRLFIRALVIVLVFLVLTSLAQNLGLQALVSLFVILPLLIELEDVESILSVHLVIQAN